MQKKIHNLLLCLLYVFNSTFVDLPGITEVSVGNQPEAAVARIRTTIRLYIKP